MSVSAIIAEYNPFHNGHLYNLTSAKELTGCDKTIAVMSGNYTQRGDVSITDKLTRARMAVACGVDIVIELPLHFACSSAGDFAKGGVSTLNACGIIDNIAFGCEGSEGMDNASYLNELNTVADIIKDEPEAYKTALKEALRSGCTYPAAREKALSECLTGPSADHLKKPNNILALEYIKALKDSNSSMKPYAVSRQGADHDSNLSSSGIASGLSIRNTLSAASYAIESVSDYIPAPAYDILKNQGHFSHTEGTSPFLLAELARQNDYSHIYDINEELSNRILSNREFFKDFSSFAELIKSKQYTLSKIKRDLMHIIHDITDDDMDSFSASSNCMYIKILAYKKEAADLLRSLYENSSVPVLMRDSDAKRYLSKDALSIYTKCEKADLRYGYCRIS